MKKFNPLLSLLSEELDYRDVKVKEFTVKETTIQVVRDFIEEWHYSSNINGLRVSHVFGLFHGYNLVGAMIYGSLGMANAWRKYADSEDDVIELRRLCCIDNTPKNTESYFIAKTLKWLKKNTDYKIVVSYADAYHNHQGTIYKASNFNYEGLTAKGKLIEFEGRTFHDKSIRTYYVNANGEKKLKPFAQRLKSALESGEASYVDTPGKHIYTYRLS